MEFPFLNGCALACIFLLRVNSETTENMCKSMLPDDYEVHQQPYAKYNKPVKIYNLIHILDLGEINEEKMEFHLNAYHKLMWKDPRIRPKNFPDDPSIPRFLTRKCLTYLWQPNIYYETAKAANLFESSAPAIIFSAYSDGKVSVTKRYLFRASCHMQFKYYPFDRQQCEFYISLQSPDSQTLLKWIDEEGSPFRQMSPMNYLRKIEPLEYTLGKIITKKTCDTVPYENFTNLVAVFVFNRRLVGKIINTFIPSTLIVCMSWVGFWLGADAVPARTALSITAILTLFTQAYQSQRELPTVNYVKAVDIWMFVNIFIVFSTLIEFAIAYNCHRKKKYKIKDKFINKGNTRSTVRSIPSRTFVSPKNNIFRKRTPSVLDNDDLSPNILQAISSGALERCWTRLQQCNVDSVSQVLYPVFFVFFVVVYWAYFLNIYFRDFEE